MTLQEARQHANTMTGVESKIWAPRQDMSNEQRRNYFSARSLVGHYYVNGIGAHAKLYGEYFDNALEAIKAYDETLASTGTAVLELITAPYQHTTIRIERGNYA